MRRCKFTKGRYCRDAQRRVRCQNCLLTLVLNESADALSLHRSTHSQRQRDNEARAFAQAVALSLNAPVVRFDNRLCNRQADA